MTEVFKKDKEEKTETSNAREDGSGSKIFRFWKKNKRGVTDHTMHTTLSVENIIDSLTPPPQIAQVMNSVTPYPTAAAPKPDVNDVMVSSLASDHSGSGPSASTLGHTMATTNLTALEHNPSNNQPTLPSTSTAPGQMQAVSSPSSSAPKPDVNDVMVSTLASDFTQMQVDHSGSGPSASTLGHTVATTNPTALEHNRSKKREQSRISSRVTIGQEKAFNEVRDCLTKSEVGMVGIYGMGGVGKTTLMKKVCYEFLKPSNFKVIWIVVSRPVNVGAIQRFIMEELNLKFNKDQDPEARGMDINEALFNSKDKVALLLDDIWESLDLEELGVAGGFELDTSKFKIIFTTRSEDVCMQMHPDQKMKIERLGPIDSWALFKQNVGDMTLNSHDQIIGLAKDVAKECARLPLALTVVGKAMVCKTSLGAWNDALKCLRSCPSLILGAEKNLFECLKFSYDNLEDQVERECFLFCCMHPEDKEIDKDTLVGSWIGEGLLDIGYGTYEETWNRGHSIIDTLVAKSLLEVMQLKYRSKVVRVKMHDVIRDMGLWIGAESNYFIHTASLRLSGEQIAKRWNTARWIYFEGHNDDLPQELDCPNLSSLHINCRKYGLDMVGIMNSLNFKCKVKVLIVENVWFEYSTIPMFGQFVGLRHLEIKNSDLRALPDDIGNLTKLLVLILIRNDKLSTLPPTIGGLCELRKLQISECALLKNIPSEVGKLKKLEMVEISVKEIVYKGNIFNEYTKLIRVPLKVEDYNFNNLPSNSKKGEEVCIKNWETAMRSKNGPFLIEGLKRLTSLKVLRMVGWRIQDKVILAIGAMCQLPELRIIRCVILELVIPALTDLEPLNTPLNRHLEVLEISYCRGLESVTFRALQSLCSLRIRHCRRLRCISGLKHLLQLRELVLSDLDFAVGLYHSLGPHCLPNLQRLRLESLWGMTHICNDNVSFPSLSEFTLVNCPMLKKLPRGLMNENKSTPKISGEIAGTEKWWEKLAWQDPEFESYLRPLFRASSEDEYPYYPSLRMKTIKTYEYEDNDPSEDEDLSKDEDNEDLSKDEDIDD